MGWTWDTFETYRLRQVDLDGFLARTFGKYEFNIQVQNGYFYFWVPRKLSEEEREEVAALRIST